MSISTLSLQRTTTDPPSSSARPLFTGSATRGFHSDSGIRYAFLGTVIAMCLLAGVGTLFAGQDKVTVAIIDHDLRQPKQAEIIPPTVTEKYEYYEVTGSSEKEIRCQMTQNGCKWSDGKKYDAVTNWHVTWNYGYDRTPRSCSADSFRAAVEITFKFPKWVRNEDTSQPLLAKWDTYTKNLITHENGHRDLAIEAAADLSRAVAELPPSATCAEIDRQIRALCNDRMKKLNTAEKRYDDTTIHGMKQGALFP